MKGAYIILLVTLLFSCSENEVAFYNIDKNKIIDGRTNSLIKSDYLKCNGRIGFYAGEDSGIELITEIHNNSKTIVKSISYSIRPNKHSEPNFHYCYFLVKDQSICNQSELQTDELITAINNNPWTTAIYHFKVKKEDYDSIFIDYNVDLVFNGGHRRQLIGSEIFKKGIFIQPLSR